MGVKRTRQRLGSEAYAEDSSSSGVNVACGAVVPHSELGGVGNRRVTKPPGSTLPGLSEDPDQDMASSPTGTEGALSFGEQASLFLLHRVFIATLLDLTVLNRCVLAEVASLRAAASAAVAECTKVVDSEGVKPGPAVRSSRNAVRPSSAKSVADRVRPGARKTGPRLSDDQDSLSSRADSRESDTGSVSSSGTGQQLPSRGPRDPAKVKSQASSGALPQVFPGHGCPPHGAKAICGRRPRMEDAYTAIPFLMEVLVPADVLGQSDILPPRIASLVKSATNSPTSSVSDPPDTELEASGVQASRTSPGSSALDSPKASNFVETLHFFGVFDGHGGAEGALHCAQTLHQRFVEAILEHTSPAGASSAATEQMETSIASTAATSVEASGEGLPSAAACGVASRSESGPAPVRDAQNPAAAVADADTDSNSRCVLSAQLAYKPCCSNISLRISADHNSYFQVRVGFAWRAAHAMERFNNL